MAIHVEIPKPLAGQVQDTAKSCATSLEDYAIDAVSKSLAQDASVPTAATSNGQDDPLLGLFSDDPELAGFIAKTALERRRTLSMRTPRS